MSEWWDRYLFDDLIGLEAAAVTSDGSRHIGPFVRFGDYLTVDDTCVFTRNRLVGPGKKSICVRTSRGPILLRSAVEPEEEAKRLRELGVLERRYIIDHPAHGQVFYDFLTDKGWKALDFAWYVGLV